MKLFNLFVIIFVSLNLIYLTNASSSTCENCLKKGEKCMTSYIIGFQTYYRDEEICSPGYVCGPLLETDVDNEADYVCMKLAEENESCFKPNLCDVGLICTDEKICVSGKFAAVGDKCDLDSDCYKDKFKCIDGTCQRPGDTCDSNSSCLYNYYCKYTDKGRCLPKYALGHNCTITEHCADNLVCTKNTGTDKSCQPQKFDQLGGYCSSSSDCDKTNGLYCSKQSNKCELYIEPVVSYCNYSGIVLHIMCDEFHTCSSCDAICYQSSLYPTQYLEYEKPLIDCAISNNCTLNPNINIESPDSCVSRNCGSEYCKSLRGVKTDNNPRSCQRDHYVNTYCDRNSSSKLSISMFTLFILILIVLLI